jgi:raffinose/stachyose/melibiose transport system permease protein
LTALTDRRRNRRADRASDTRPGGLRRTPFSYIGLGILALYAGLPLVVLVFNSLKSRLDLGLNPLGFPSELDFSNYSRAWVQGGIGQGMLNSAILVVGTIVGVWICAGRTLSPASTRPLRRRSAITSSS